MCDRGSPAMRTAAVRETRRRVHPLLEHVERRDVFSGVPAAVPLSGRWGGSPRQPARGAVRPVSGRQPPAARSASGPRWGRSGDAMTPHDAPGPAGVVNGFVGVSIGTVDHPGPTVHNRLKGGDRLDCNWSGLQPVWSAESLDSRRAAQWVGGTAGPGRRRTRPSHAGTTGSDAAAPSGGIGARGLREPGLSARCGR